MGDDVYIKNFQFDIINGPNAEYGMKRNNSSRRSVYSGYSNKHPSLKITEVDRANSSGFDDPNPDEIIMSKKLKD